MSWKEALHGLAHTAEEAFDERRRRLQAKLGWLDPVRILPYRGFATGERLRLRGRVMEAQTREVTEEDTLWDDLVRWFRRVESDEVPGATLVARWGDREEELTTGGEGFFELDLEGGPRPGGELAWREVELEMVDPVRRDEGPARAAGPVLVPAAGADFVVVSDLDDTVIRTGADNQLRMARTIFLNNARTRTAFPGVGAFYRALQRGRNPIFYVSSSPWNYYELFDQFLELQGIPPGPIFLKEFGLDESKLFKSGHSDHKLERVRHLMAAYPELPFVLVGDSGQEDAEIYAALAEEAGERIRAVYVRDVTAEARDAEVREIAERVAGSGVEMRLVADTVAAARHAEEAGLVAEGTVREVESEKEAEEAEGRGVGLKERVLGG